jgi:hypothetical protein
MAYEFVGGCKKICAYPGIARQKAHKAKSGAHERVKTKNSETVEARLTGARGDLRITVYHAVRSMEKYGSPRTV